MTTNGRSSQELAVSPDVIAKASEVGPRASIRDVRLTDLNVRLNDAQGDLKPSFVRWNRAFGFNRLEEHPGLVSVHISFKLEMAYSTEQPEPSAVIDSTYSLIYDIVDLGSLDDDHLKAFAEVNGFFNAWPFWRELCSTMAARMGLGMFVLPTMRVTSTNPTPAT